VQKTSTRQDTTQGQGNQQRLGGGVFGLDWVAVLGGKW